MPPTRYCHAMNARRPVILPVASSRASSTSDRPKGYRRASSATAALLQRLASPGIEVRRGRARPARRPSSRSARHCTMAVPGRRGAASLSIEVIGAAPRRFAGAARPRTAPRAARWTGRSGRSGAPARARRRSGASLPIERQPDDRVGLFGFWRTSTPVTPSSITSGSGPTSETTHEAGRARRSDTPRPSNSEGNTKMSAAPIQQGRPRGAETELGDSDPAHRPGHAASARETPCRRSTAAHAGAPAGRPASLRSGSAGPSEARGGPRSAAPGSGAPCRARGAPPRHDRLPLGAHHPACPVDDFDGSRRQSHLAYGRLRDAVGYRDVAVCVRRSRNRRSRCAHRSLRPFR